MRAGLGGWLFTVLTVSLFCALAEALMPPGPVKRVGKLVCGLALLCGVLGPLGGLDESQLRDFAAEWDLEVVPQEELQAQLDETMKAGIERQCAAYIQDKATQRGITCTVQVGCRETEGVWVPDRAVVTGALSVSERGEVASLLTEDLAIPAQRQRYVTEEEVE